MSYDVDYFIRKFEAIPDELWTTGKCVAGEKRCAIGHCGERSLRNDDDYGPEAQALISILGAFDTDVTDINDGCYLPENDPSTPKQRILKALYEIKSTQAHP